MCFRFIFVFLTFDGCFFICTVPTCVLFSCPNCRYDQGGYALTSQSLSETAGRSMRMNWKTLSDVKNENLGHGEKVQNTYMLFQSVHTS